MRPRFYRHRQWWWSRRAMLFDVLFTGCEQYTRHPYWKSA